MSQNNVKLHAALVIACAALALSLYGVLRGSGGASSTAGHACVDQDARDQADRLRRAAAERDAAMARLVRNAAAAGAPEVPAAAGEPAEPAAAPPREPGPRRFTHFEVPNPAVSVTQKEDGSYDIRTTDPALAGSVMQVTAVTQSGEEEKMLIRIPQ